LINRFVYDTFSDVPSTISVDTHTRQVCMAGRTIRLRIEDIMGSSRVRNVAPHYRGIHGVILAYDTTDDVSFQNARLWADEISRYARSNVARILVGTKCDLPSSTPRRDGRRLASELGARFLKTSAKDCINIDQLFLGLCQCIVIPNPAGVIPIDAPHQPPAAEPRSCVIL
jgi:Ras-related protein Rab-1A